MQAEYSKFAESISTLSEDDLRQLVTEEHIKRLELEAREEENQRIYLEMHIQFCDLKKKYDDLSALYQDTKKLLQKEVEKNLLKTRSTFGRSTEKFTDLIKSANNKGDDFVDEDESEDTDDTNTNTRIIDFPGKKEKANEEINEKKGTIKNPSVSGRKSKLKESMENLPHEIVYDINFDLLNELYGEGNWRIAYWHKHETLEKIPVLYFVRETYTPAISVGLEHQLYTVPYENVLMPHAYVSPSLLADIIYRKFVLGLPFYRQAVDFQMSNVALLKQTIIHWVNTIAPDLLDPVCDYLTAKLVKYRYVQSDETYIQVNKDGRGSGHKSFMWVHCSSELADCDPIVIFCYEATRGTDHLRRLFGEFLGYITCDAYVSYPVIEGEVDGLTVTGCLMHCRRYFAEALFINDVASMTDEEIVSLPETKVLLLIREIYIEENKLKGMSADDRLSARQEFVQPKVDALFDYIHELNDTDMVYSDRLKKAIAYAINQEEKLRVFLTDGSIPCDNGKSERIIRAYSVGRANWLFADTIVGANVNATIYSIVETAKANSVNVRIYLQYLLEKMLAHKIKYQAFDDGFLETMMPWSPEYKKYEKDTSFAGIDAFHRMFPEPDKPKIPHPVKSPADVPEKSAPCKIA